MTVSSPLILPAGSKELVVSYIGYKEQAIIVSGNAPLNIKMVPDTQALDEVVVIGYGTVKKRDLTGAVASVKSEDITMNPGVNPMDALQGKIAGLDITNSSGQAGSSPTVQLRGTRSLRWMRMVISLQMHLSRLILSMVCRVILLP